MNKTFAEIYTELLAGKEANANLSGLTSTSKTAIWRQFLEVVAFAIYNFQLAMVLHLNNIQYMIDNQKNFRLQQYRSEALRFQYGFDLLPESDQFATVYEENGLLVTATDEVIEASKIVKYAACSRVVNNGKVSIIMKIAPENLDEIFPSEVMDAFGKYIEEIQPAGDHVTIVNYLPDMLKFAFNIKRDPKVLKSDGMNILTAEYPVQTAIENFLKNNLPFNGELSIQKLEDAIRAVEGVDDLTMITVQTKWIDPLQNGYGLYQPVQMSVVPQSGRFKIEDYTGLNYIV